MGIAFPSLRAEPTVIPPVRLDYARIELEQQLQQGAPPIEYWDAVAKCESNNRWHDHGTYAGGLGIFTRGNFTIKSLRTDAGTWERWGGEQFATSPDKATKQEQIVIANRIALFGFRTSFTIPAGLNGALITYPYRKQATGFMGWGCIKNHKSLHPQRWKRR